MIIRLLDRHGDFVREMEILPFVLLPEIMVYGTRYFSRNIFWDHIGADGRLVAGYTEACVFHVDVMDIVNTPINFEDKP